MRCLAMIQLLSQIRSAFLNNVTKPFTNINNEGKKCHTHLVSFIKHHGLFVPYIVDILFF